MATSSLPAQDLSGLVIAGAYRLRELRWAQPIAGFAAERVVGGEPVLIRLWPRDAVEDDGLVARHLEATFVRYPFLLPCFGSGVVELQAGPHVWAAYAFPQVFLNEVPQPVPAEELRHVAQNLVSGLEELHSRGLVYGSLDAHTVALYQGRWVLADYSQLRLTASDAARETRRLLGVLPAAPPEAYMGEVSPAWDVWGLARLLQLLLIGNMQGETARRNESLPEPFATIIAGGLVSDWRNRCTLPHIEQMLRQPVKEMAPISAAESALPPAYLPGDFRLDSRFEDDGERRRPRVANWRALLFGLVGLGLVLLIVISAWQSLSLRADLPPAKEVPTEASANTDPARNLEPLPFRPEPDPTTPAEDPVADSGKIKEEASTPKPEERPEVQVQQAVQRWADTLRRGDLVAHVGSYAERLDRYNESLNAPLSQVYKNKSDLVRKSGGVVQFQISRPRVQMQGPNRAIASFEKTLQIAGAQAGSGRARSELELERTPKGWRIVSERDTQVF